MKKLLALLALVALFPWATNASLYHYYNEQLPSIEERAITAAEVGIWNYRGTYDQNILLEQRLRENDSQFGASVVSRYRTRLSSSMTSTQTTVPVSSLETFDGHTLTIDDVDGVVFLTIEPGSSREEIVKCESISSTSWATCTRGLAFYGTTETSVAANRKAHNSGSIVVMSNVHYVYEQLTDKDSIETINGVKTFSQYPLGPGTAPTSSAQLIDKSYADTLAIQGGVTSTEALTGITQLGTQLEMASSTWDGNQPTVIQTQYTTSTPDVRGLYIPVAENDGYLNQGWLDLSEDYVWTGTHTIPTSTIATSTITDLTVTSSTIDTLNVTDLKASQLKISLTAGENLTAGDAVMIGDGTDTILEASCTENADTNYTLTTTAWGAQTFTTSADAAYITRVSARMIDDSSSPAGNIVASIRATSAGEPTGSDINSETKSISANLTITPTFYDFTFDNPIPVDPNTVYAVVLRRDNTGDNVYWKYDNSGGSYGGGIEYESSDSGSSWTVSPSGSRDFLFRVYEGQTTIGEIYKTDATSDTERANNFIGFADEAITSGSTGYITIQGVDDNQSSLSPGYTYYLSDTPGAISTSAGSQSRLIGRALSSTQIKIINNF